MSTKVKIEVSSEATNLVVVKSVCTAATGFTQPPVELAPGESAELEVSGGTQLLIEDGPAAPLNLPE